MSRRGGSIRFKCASDGCPESRVRGYENQREAAERRTEQQRTPWRCEYHDEAADRMLSPTNLTRSGTVTAVVLDNLPNHRFWLLDGEPEYKAVPTIDAPGFRANAQDFPAGTRVMLTATVVLPEVES